MTVWALPFPTSTITSPFGYRTAPYKAFHTGVDFGSNNGKVIKAPAAGTVVAKGYNANRTSGWGHYLWVEADDGAFYGVAHMRAASEFDVEDRVDLGDTLGYVGATGAAATYGPHLHLTISTGTKAQAVALNRDHLVDPVAYIEARSTGTAGGGGTPFIERNDIMPMVIWDGQNPAGGFARWALIGLEPGKPMTTKDEGKAKRWASSLGVTIFDCGSAAEYDSYIQWVQRPLSVTGGAGGSVAVDLSPVVAAIEQLGVKLGASDLSPVLKAIEKVPTAEQNGAAARAAIVR